MVSAATAEAPLPPGARVRPKFAVAAAMRALVGIGGSAWKAGHKRRRYAAAWFMVLLLRQVQQCYCAQRRVKWL
jgi:hypothetical protein